MAPFFIISVAVFLNGGMSFIISMLTCWQHSSILTT
jgi:hypothetical protein